MTPLIALIALIIDVAIGWPARLFQKITHPVVWLGLLVTTLEGHLNHGPMRVLSGAITTVIVVIAAIIPAIILQDWLGTVAAGILAWPLIAAHSLLSHLRAVQFPLEAGNLPHARKAVSMIVGRDVSQADEAALARASVESLAENTSDGVIAPLFWAMLAGLPGIAAYKAINTLDSMIGHRSPRYLQFGCFAARLDDAVNWIPARMTTLLFALAATSTYPWRVARRDAGSHRSPNAGWPEAAMAAALGIRVSGPRVYHGEIADEPWIHPEGRQPQADDIARAIRLYRCAVAIAGAGLAIAVFLKLGL